MTDYKAPVEDILFALRTGADVTRLADWNDELAEQVLYEAARLIDSEIAPIDPVCDATPAQLANGRVTLAPCMGTAYSAFCQAGWPGIVIEESYGGQNLPHVLGSAISEMLSGACMSLQMLLSLGQGTMQTILAHGTDEQKRQYLPKLASGKWLSTMCLTEPDAGSDLSRIRTMATPQDDGSWRIDGGKIFITGGDHDLTDNIIHLVLARTPDAPPGVKGLSLFVCPARLDTGERNRLSVVRLEEKMGLHAAPTCQMSFEGAQAEILGQPGEGLARMFTMMNATRLDVAVQGVGQSQVAMQRAHQHAVERRQGGDGTRTINQHGDVQRMLLTQSALTMGCRALCYRTDVELELNPESPLGAFLTPVCKAFSTDTATEVANLSLQVHGGYGYCREYRVEQTLRDCRITGIYEGTNGIQAMTLAGRMARIKEGECAKAFHDSIEEGAMTPALQKALESWSQATDFVQRMEDPGLVAKPYLRLTGLVALGSAWARMVENADKSHHPDRIRTIGSYYQTALLPEASYLSQTLMDVTQYNQIDTSIFEVT